MLVAQFLSVGSRIHLDLQKNLEISARQGEGESECPRALDSLRGLPEGLIAFWWGHRKKIP